MTAVISLDLAIQDPATLIMAVAEDLLAAAEEDHLVAEEEDKLDFFII
jgi:hypothetical protein